MVIFKVMPSICKLLALFFIACHFFQSNKTGAEIQHTRVVLTGLFAYNVTDILITPHRRNVANGRVVEEAVRLALKDISTTPNLLPNVSLELEPVSTECDPARCAWGLTNTLKYTSLSEPVLILGPPCEDSANYLVRVTSQFTNIITLSYSASTPQINDAAVYKNFFRTVPTFSELNGALFYVLKHFGWNNVCIVLEMEPFYNTAAEKLHSYMRSNSHNLTILETVSLKDIRSITHDSYCRIFLVFAEPIYFPEIFCEASRINLFGELYQWIILGDMEESDLVNNTEVNCSKEELLKFGKSALVISFDRETQLAGNDSLWQSHMNRTEFEAKLHNVTGRLNVTQNDRDVAASAYDATWAIALGLNSSVESLLEMNSSLNDYLPIHNDSISDLIIESFESLSFKGVSKNIDFTVHRHHAQSIIKISQIQGNQIVPVGLYYNSTYKDIKNLTYFGNDFAWIGDGPPKDTPSIKNDELPLWIQVVVYIISVFGCLLIIVFILMNSICRKRRVIKASSPHINTLILLGCLFGFVSVIVYTIAVNTNMLDIVRSISCNVTVWGVNVMFTLSFGALLAKTWRVYAVFQNPWTKRRIYKDHMLIVIVMCMLGVDILVLTVWMIVSPLKTQMTELISPEVITVVSYCAIKSQGIYFSLVLIGYKCLLLILGCFLAIQTRKIKAKCFKDAKYIAIAIYGVFLTVLVGLPLAIFFLIGFNTFLSYISITWTILCISFLIACTVYVPKLVLLYKTYNKETTLNPLSPTLKSSQRNVLHRDSFLPPRQFSKDHRLSGVYQGHYQKQRDWMQRRPSDTHFYSTKPIAAFGVLSAFSNISDSLVDNSVQSQQKPKRESPIMLKTITEQEDSETEGQVEEIVSNECEDVDEEHRPQSGTLTVVTELDSEITTVSPVQWMNFDNSNKEESLAITSQSCTSLSTSTELNNSDTHNLYLDLDSDYV